MHRVSCPSHVNEGLLAGVIQLVECLVANENAAGSYPATCLANVVQNIARSPNGMASVLHTEIIRVRFPGEQLLVDGETVIASAF